MTTLPACIPFRRLILMPWRWSRWRLVTVAIPMAFVLYALSYAPWMRFERNCRRISFGAYPFPTVGPVVYRPLDWFYDHTFLRAPFQHWADFCGVGIELEISSLIRRHPGVRLSRAIELQRQQAFTPDASVNREYWKEKPDLNDDAPASSEME